MTRHAEQRAPGDDIHTAELLGGGAELDPATKQHPESMGGGVQDPLGTKAEHAAAALARRAQGERGAESAST
jgi:hypothetical protein